MNGYADLTDGKYEEISHNSKHIVTDEKVWTLIDSTTVKKTEQQYYDDGSEFVLHVIVWSKK